MLCADATQKTAALIGYDDTALYVALIMSEEHTDRLRTHATKRTRDIDVQTWMNKDDSIQMMIDPRRDGVHYVHYLVNPAGKWMTSRGQGCPDAIECDYEWTPADWEFETAVESDRWTVRMRIGVADLGLHRLHKGQMLGIDFLEWDSDVWSVATGMYETPEWSEYPEETPATTGTHTEEEKTLRHAWQLFKGLSHDYIVGMNCWRCIDHYGLEWGGRAACIEITGAGNPSVLTQLAFARGAARQYGTYFITYHATFLASDYTKYEGGLEFIPSHEGVYAAGPDSGPSALLHKRLLFTSHLSGSTVQSLEHPQTAHNMPAKKEGEYKLSPHGDAMADVLEYNRRYADRGVPYQPVALLLDYLHGFAPPYQSCFAVGRSGMQTWFSVPYERGDHQVFQTFWTIFPWSRQEIERNGVTVRPGDIKIVEIT